MTSPPRGVERSAHPPYKLFVTGLCDVLNCATLAQLTKRKTRLAHYVSRSSLGKSFLDVNANAAHGAVPLQCRQAALVAYAFTSTIGVAPSDRRVEDSRPFSTALG